ncbi:MAG: tetratricopeptide repeat-containing diguanylate cyclase [Sarcina sp.]
MRNRLNKDINRIIIIFLSVFIIAGLVLNYKLKNNVDINQEERILLDEEKEYIMNVLDDEKKDAKEFEKKYLKILDEIKAKEAYYNKDEDIAKIYYFLGVNAYLDNDYIKTVNYLEYSMDVFENIPNYFYRLNGNNILMNLAYVRNDYVEGINRANEIYEILETPNIKGMSENGQLGIKTSVLNGLINISAKLGMMDMAKTYYEELVEITEVNKKFEDNIAIYVKYVYNYVTKNYEEAKKYAKKYIDYQIEKMPEDKETANNSYFYLAEVLIELNDFAEAEKALEKVESTEKITKDLAFKASVIKVKGILSEKMGEYEDAFRYYNEALKLLEEEDLREKDYESLIFVNEKIILLADDIKINIESYIKNLESYKAVYDKDSIVGALADSLTKTAYKKNAEESARVQEELARNTELTNISKKLNFIYLGIIILLIIMSKKLKNEILTRKSKEVELEKMVRTDYLTKAYSKQFIFEKTKKLIVNEEQFTFIIFDLDNFKKINDNYGHTFGDEVLVKIVQKIKEKLNDKGCIGRFGGEEFVIILNEEIQPSKFIEELRSEIAQIEYSIEDVKATISGGAIRYKGQECDELVYDADVLLYKAKTEGKDRILLR